MNEMLEINVDKKIIIRKANKNDDLERISELIYNVDPYIYPYWFENLENCKKILPKLILEDNFIFNIETIYIAINCDNNDNDVEYIEFDVLTHNPSAIKLYKNLGFVQISDIEEGFNGNNMEKSEIILMSLKIK